MFLGFRTKRLKNETLDSSRDLTYLDSTEFISEAVIWTVRQNHIFITKTLLLIYILLIFIDIEKESQNQQTNYTQSQQQMVNNTPCIAKKNKVAKLELSERFINKPSTSNDIYNMNQLLNNDESSNSASKNESSDDENDSPNIMTSPEERDTNFENDEEKEEIPPPEETITSPCTPNNQIPIEEKSTEKAYPSQIENLRFKCSQNERNSSKKENFNSYTDEIINNNNIIENKAGTKNGTELFISLNKEDEKTSKNLDLSSEREKVIRQEENKINNIDSFEDILITTSQLNELDNFCNKVKNIKTISSIRKEEVPKDSENSNYTFFNFPLPSINWSQKIQEEKNRLRNITNEISHLK